MNPNPPHQSSGASPQNAEYYERLLREAVSLKGVSLWQDAGRRLRRNWAARISLWFLIAIVALAVLTPVLPLQSPMMQELTDARKLRPPNIVKVSLGEQEDLNFKDHSLVAELSLFDEKIAALDQRIAAAGPEARKYLEKERYEELNEHHLLGRLWNRPGIITRGMIRIRLALFGDWCIPSICGTDDLGRDLLSQIFWGARISLAVGLVATLVSLMIGVAFGAIAGYYGGVVDAIMMRIVDILYSVPFIFVVIFLISIIEDPGFKEKYIDALGIDKITVFFVVIGAIYWLTMARVVRGQIISLKNEQFVEAARTLGASKPRIIFLHLVPNVMGVVIVYLTLTIPSVMLFEAFLSFLGLGVSPPDVSWGLLAQKGIQVITPIKIYWWLVAFPGLALSMTLFALNFLGDGLRDALDPRMKNR